MVTLVVEIIHKNVEYKGYYTPAVEGFQKGCRTNTTIITNMKKLINKALKSDFVKEFRIIEYKGKYESYKNNDIIRTYEINDLYDMGLMD